MKFVCLTSMVLFVLTTAVYASHTNMLCRTGLVKLSRSMSTKSSYMKLREKVVVGDMYEHYKGSDKRYKVLHVGRCSQNPDHEVVIYQALYASQFGKDSVWTRPLEEFAGLVEIAGQRVDRFKRIVDEQSVK